MSFRSIRVGILGCGNVGTVVATRLIRGAEALTSRSGMSFEVKAIGVHDLKKKRDGSIPSELFTDDLMSVVNNPDIDVILEVMGGIDPAQELVLAAIHNHKPVVTANKELLATHPEIHEAAAAENVDLLFEAAVGGGIPVIRPLRESLAGERISRALGIVNGTTNYILSSMAESNTSYDDALAQAQEKGYAEPDPSADVEGRDAAAKAAILASLAFGSRVVLGDVYCEGITALTADDFATAKGFDCTIKLLAIVEQLDDGSVSARVHPTLVPLRHPLATVRDAFNAVFIEGQSVGELMLYGRGAGGEPTATSVIGDLVDASHNLLAGGAGRTPRLENVSLVPFENTVSPFFLELFVRDEPGVLASVAAVFGESDVSIRSVEQVTNGEEARLLFATHSAQERDVQETIGALGKLESVLRVGSVLRMLA